MASSRSSGMKSISRLHPHPPKRRMCTIIALELAPDPQQASSMQKSPGSTLMSHPKSRAGSSIRNRRLDPTKISRTGTACHTAMSSRHPAPRPWAHAARAANQPPRRTSPQPSPSAPNLLRTWGVSPAGCVWEWWSWPADVSDPITTVSAQSREPWIKNVAYKWSRIKVLMEE